MSSAPRAARRSTTVVVLVALLVAVVVALAAFAAGSSREPAPAAVAAISSPALAAESAAASSDPAEGAPSPTRPTPSARPGGYLTPIDVGRLLRPGAYAVGRPFAKDTVVTLPGRFTLESLSTGAAVFSSPRGRVGIYLPASAWDDPCGGTGQRAVTSADDLVSTLGSLPGFRATTPRELLLGRRFAQALTLEREVAAPAAACRGTAPVPLVAVAGDDGAPPLAAGAALDLWVIDGRPGHGLGDRGWEGPIVIAAGGWDRGGPGSDAALGDPDRALLRAVAESVEYR